MSRIDLDIPCYQVTPLRMLTENNSFYIDLFIY